jgi:hypothetical protein
MLQIIIKIINKEEMNTLRIRLIQSLKDFVSYAFLTEELFNAKYSFEGPAIKSTTKHKGVIPMRGELEYKDQKISYRFHGLGCEFIFDDDTIVDFDYSPPDWQFKEISFFFFWQFVKSRIPEFNDKELLQNYLDGLETENIIRRGELPYSGYVLIEKEKI